MKTIGYLLITMLILTASAAGVYAGLDDKSDRLSNEQSGVFSPGYINVTMQKTQAIIRQAESGSGNTIDNETELMNNNLSNNVNKDADDKAALQLQKKTSSGENNKTVKAAAATQIMASNSSNQDIKIGSGTSKDIENGRLISEVIGGTRYVYAGFDNVGVSTIQAAVNYASNTPGGGTVIVRGWASTDPNATSYSGNILLGNGVSLFGGYDETGIRDITGTPSIIAGRMTITDATTPAEINGFIFDAPTRINNAPAKSSDIYVISSSNLTITNNTFNFGVAVNNSSIIFTYNTENSPKGEAGASKAGQNYLFLTATNGSSIDSSYNNYTRTTIKSVGSSITSNNDYFGGSNPLNYGGTLSVTNPVTQPNEQLVSTHTSLQSTDQNTFSATPYSYNNLSTYEYDLTLYSDSIGKNGLTLGLDNTTVTSIFKGLLNSEEDLTTSGSGQIDPELLQKLVNRTLEESGLADITDASSKEMSLAMMLANILKNPTEDQKLVLDTTMALLNDINKNEDKESQSPEVKRAQDNLIQVAANILIAQAIPDLLKEGDMANIKGMFNDLDTQKTKLILEYNESIKPYYTEVKKLLSSNLAMLQLNNIISKTMAEEELNKLEPNEVNKIINKLKKSNISSSEKDYILQEEAKYRVKYIDPNRKVFDDNLKTMLQGFTVRLSKLLEAAKK